jgi:hypothetical protein
MKLFTIYYDAGLVDEVFENDSKVRLRIGYLMNMIYFFIYQCANFFYDDKI